MRFSESLKKDCEKILFCVKFFFWNCRMAAPTEHPANPFPPGHGGNAGEETSMGRGRL